MLLEKLFSVERSVSTADMPEEWLITAMGGRKSSSGEQVTPTTAMSLSTYWACLRNISEDCAKFPFKLFRERAQGGREHLSSHPVNRLILVEPNPEMTPMNFWETMYQWAMGWGRAPAEIERNGIGRPKYLWPIHPSCAHLKRREDGRLVWKVFRSKGDDRPTYVPDEDMFHLHGMGDGLTGFSVAQVGTESIGRALASQTYSGAFFAGGASNRVAIKFPAGAKELTPVGRDNLRRDWQELYGGAENHKPAVLVNGGDIAVVGIPPEQAQMLETARFTVEDIARWFRCPTSKVQHWLQAKGWSTLDAENKDYFFDTLTPWLLRAQQEVNRKLLMKNEEALYAKHIINFLMWADPAARSAYLQTRLRSGTLSINEWRELEDENPIEEGGDTYWIEGNNLMPVDKVVNPPEPVATPEPVPPVSPVPEPEAPSDSPEDNPQMTRATSAAKAFVNEEFARALRKETKANQAAARKHLMKGDIDGWRKWLDEFYAEWPAEMATVIGPSMVLLCELDGIERDSKDMFERHATSSRAQLLGVHRDEGASGVVARLESWPTAREFKYE